MVFHKKTWSPELSLLLEFHVGIDFDILKNRDAK